MFKYLISALLIGCLTGPAFSAWQKTSTDRPLLNAASNALSSLIAANSELTSQEAARLVQRQTGGKVLRVNDSGSFYQVKVLLQNGVVRSYSVNKVTGTIS